MKFAARVTGATETKEELDRVAGELEARRFKGRLVDVLQFVKTTMQKEAPKDLGGLRKSVYIDAYAQGNQAVGEVGASAFYSKYVNQGTGVFAGNARYMPPGRALHGWATRHGFANGFVLAQSIYSKGGTRPNPFIERTFDKTKDRIVREIEGAVVEIVE